MANVTTDRLMQARCRLLTRDPWYGHVAMKMSWIKSEMSWIPEEAERTMGVRIVNGGEVQCLYYQPWVDTLTIKELFGVIQHEIEHIVRCHCVRCFSRDHRVWNIAADMCVNGVRKSPRVGYDDAAQGRRVLPHEDQIVWIPDNWPSDLSAEEYYDMLMNDAVIINTRMLDNHSVWQQTELSADEIRQVVKGMTDEATAKTQGNVPGHLSMVLDKLNKPIIKWTDYLKRYVGRYVGSSRRTFSRINRRLQLFGTKGVSHHAASDICVIVDTSGSVSDSELEQFFAEIEAMCGKYRIWLLQWDASFQGYSRYRRGDWKKIKINGRCGTDMAAPFEWLKDNNEFKDVHVMFTDGECNYAEDQHVPYICVITTDREGPSWGHSINMRMR